ncbi:MAG: hypothetical protein ACFHWZ_15235 [Phycisphaerales bacterium]
MANFDENPIKPNRDIKRDFKLAVDPPPKPKQPETPDLAYKPPEFSGPSLGGPGPTQGGGSLRKDESLGQQRRAERKPTDKSVERLGAEEGRRLISEAFNRRAKDKDNENER